MTRSSSQRRLIAVLAGVTLFAAGLALGRTMSRPSARPGVDDNLDRTPTAGELRTDDDLTAIRAHAHTRLGAVDKAAAMVAAFDGPDVLDADSRSVLLDRHAAQSSRADLDTTLVTVADLFVTNLGLTAEARDDPGFVWRAVPAGWQVREYAQARAVVAVWSTGVLIAEGLPLVQPGWRTTAVELVWERDDWRLVSFLSEPGPEPPQVGGAAGASSQARLINAFEPFAHTAPTAGGQP